MRSKVDLIIPVYIDTNALLDLLASIDNGFSLVEKITTRDTNASASEKSTSVDSGTEFGVLNILNLLKINFSGSTSNKSYYEVDREQQSERYHTYGSLLYRLRSILDKENMIKRPCDNTQKWDEIKTSDFVEIHGMFQPNPLADILGRIIRIVDLSKVNDMLLEQTMNNQNRNLKNNKIQNNKIKEILESFLKDVENKNIRMFVVRPSGASCFCTVVNLFINYLRDKSMHEISYKNYFLLGKVVRKIEDNSSETIDLLRGTGLGSLERSVLERMREEFNKMEGVNLPQAITEIKGPALEVVPIAIFV